MVGRSTAAAFVFSEYHVRAGFIFEFSSSLEQVRHVGDIRGLGNDQRAVLWSFYFLFKAGGFKEDCTRKPRGVKENIRISMYFSHSFCFYGFK